MPGIAKQLKPIVTALCESGTSKKSMDRMRMLRLYQLKIWLAWDLDDQRIMDDAAAQFTSIAITRRMRTLVRDKLTPSEALTTALKDKQLKALFDLAFAPSFSSGEYLYALSRDLDLAALAERIENESAIVACIRYVTELRIRCALTSRVKATLDNAWIRYEATYKTMNLRYGRETVRKNKLFTDRKSRTTFLYVATEFPWLVEIPSSRNEMWKMLRNQIGRTDELRKFFRKVAGVEQLLAQEDRVFQKCGDICKWIADEPIAPDLKPFNKDEIYEFKLKPE